VVIVLNGKPTEGNDFGLKVEFAMDLVSYSDDIVFCQAEPFRALQCSRLYLQLLVGEA
jgi:hypothetical protein